MKFKCRKRKKPSKHNEEKRMTQATEAEKEMGMEHKYWRANWIFICGTQKVQMRAGMGARGVAPPYRVRSCFFFFFFLFLFTWSTALYDATMNTPQSQGNSHTCTFNSFILWRVVVGHSIFAFYVRQIFVLVCETCWFPVITIVVFLDLDHRPTAPTSRKSSWPLSLYSIPLTGWRKAHIYR